MRNHPLNKGLIQTQFESTMARVFGDNKPAYYADLRRAFFLGFSAYASLAKDLETDEQLSQLLLEMTVELNEFITEMRNELGVTPTTSDKLQ